VTIRLNVLNFSEANKGLKFKDKYQKFNSENVISVLNMIC
jgi:hypothetical protein